MTMENIVSAIEIFNKAQCPGIVAFINLLKSEEKLNKKRTLTDILLDQTRITRKECGFLPDDILQLKYFLLGAYTGSVLSDILIIAMRIRDIPEASLKMFEKICVEIVETDEQIKNSNFNDYGLVF